MYKSNVLEVKRNKLENKIAEICDWDTKQGEDPKYPHVFEVYMNGEVPILIKSKVDKKEFDKLCGC
ncbi:hypothetical protein KQI86_16805 [Clostridium sp. MSJ-11]|uniref:Phage protein n=1 Tax=Clostridium mobile TaxID=2841512 RepID=A0ABS6ELT1_9CLOT|nr:hypothetical protein [Clostridium mobile]MBU5485983.1 hypothetical protein [Clostridium mobile]